MKFIFNSRCLVWLLVMLALGAVRAEAQTNNGFVVTAFNTNAVVFTGDTVTTIILVTNETGIYLPDVYVTNAFSGPVNFVTEGFYTNDFGTNSVETNGNTAVLYFQDFTNGAVAQLYVVWQPLSAGLYSNTISVYSPEATNTSHGNLVGPVYAFQADLGVSMALLTQPYVTTNYWIITNDWLTYGVTITNLGPGTATGVLLTNTLPSGSILRNASASGYTATGSNLVFNVGTLASGAGLQYQFTVQPTNAGAFALLAGLGATNGYDTNVVNNQALAAFYVTNYLPATLTQATNSGQIVDQLNGLIEQTLMVTNTGGSAVPAVRVVVTGLTNRLYNASGTNNGSPFVVCPAALAAGAHVSLRLQYNPRLPFPFTNGQLHTYALPASVLAYTPFPPAQVKTNLNFDKIVRVPGDGDMLLEFTNLGGSYTVVYSDNMQFSNAMIATPAIQSGASRIEWLDYGPPATLSAPTNSSQRFYRVYQNP